MKLLTCVWAVLLRMLYLATLDTENMQRIIKKMGETGSIWVVKNGKENRWRKPAGKNDAKE